MKTRKELTTHHSRREKQGQQEKENVMGDKSKKDKDKGEKQKTAKQQQDVKKKQEKQQKKKSWQKAWGGMKHIPKQIKYLDTYFGKSDTYSVLASNPDNIYAGSF